MSVAVKINRHNNSDRMEQYFNPIDAFFTPFDPFFPLTGALTTRPMSELTRPFAPLLSMDLIESENDFHVHCDLPGVNKEDLDITFTDNSMVIKAERKHVHESKSDTAHKIERSFGKIQRSVTLPKNADRDHASASLKDGVLTISFPKVELKKTTKLVIN